MRPALVKSRSQFRTTVIKQGYKKIITPQEAYCVLKNKYICFCFEKQSILLQRKCKVRSRRIGSRSTSSCRLAWNTTWYKFLGLESHAPCKSDSQIIYAWAKDAPTLDLPKDVGFRYLPAIYHSEAGFNIYPRCELWTQGVKLAPRV
jgi:hypothetical protein